MTNLDYLTSSESQPLGRQMSICLIQLHLNNRINISSPINTTNLCFLPFVLDYRLGRMPDCSVPYGANMITSTALSLSLKSTGRMLEGRYLSISPPRNRLSAIVKEYIWRFKRGFFTFGKSHCSLIESDNSGVAVTMSTSCVTSRSSKG